MALQQFIFVVLNIVFLTTCTCNNWFLKCDDVSFIINIVTSYASVGIFLLLFCRLILQGMNRGKVCAFFVPF